MTFHHKKIPQQFFIYNFKLLDSYSFTNDGFFFRKNKTAVEPSLFPSEDRCRFFFFLSTAAKMREKKKCSVVWAVVHRSTRPTCTRLGRWERMGEVLKPRPSTEPSHFFGRENPLKKSGGFKRVGSKWVVYITFITPRIIYPEFIYIYM